VDVGGIPASAARDRALGHPLRDPRWSKLDNEWEGVPARFMVEAGGPRRKRSGHAARRSDYTTNTSLDDLRDDDVLLALKHNGRDSSPITAGGPPGAAQALFFWKSAKWLARLSSSST